MPKVAILEKLDLSLSSMMRPDFVLLQRVKSRLVRPVRSKLYTSKCRYLTGHSAKHKSDIQLCSAELYTPDLLKTPCPNYYLIKKIFSYAKGGSLFPSVLHSIPGVSPPLKLTVLKDHPVHVWESQWVSVNSGLHF